jgi:hypothetical protein
VVRTLRAEKFAGDVEVLAADDDNLLAAEELLGDNAGQAAKQVALAIDHDLSRIAVSILEIPTLMVPLPAAPLPSRPSFPSLSPMTASRTWSGRRSRGFRGACVEGKLRCTYHRLERRHFGVMTWAKRKKEKLISHSPADRVAAGCFLTLVMVDGRSSTFLCVLKIGLVQPTRRECARPDSERVEVGKRALIVA